MIPIRYARRKTTDAFVVHCSQTRREWDGGIAEMRKWHTDPIPQGNGWIDVGYHYGIRRNGLLETGRPTWAVGSGVRGHNASTIHICLVGGAAPNGRDFEDNFTDMQWETLGRTIVSLYKRYPTAVVKGHRDYPGVNKWCPGFDANAWWQKWAKTNKVTV